MSSPADLALFDEHVERWMVATTAFRRGDIKSVGDTITPPDATDGKKFAWLVSMAVMGAIVCATEVAKFYGRIPADPDDAGKYLLADITPGHEPPATTRMANLAILAAANGDLERVADMLTAYASPDVRGIQRMVDLHLVLLRIHVALLDLRGVSA